MKWVKSKKNKNEWVCECKDYTLYCTKQSEKVWNAYAQKNNLMRSLFIINKNGCIQPNDWNTVSSCKTLREAKERCRKGNFVPM